MSKPENDVFIVVHDESGRPIDVSGWSVTYPQVPNNNYPKGANDASHRQPFTFEQRGNRIGMRYYAGRSLSTHVAANYLNAGHQTGLDGEWPSGKHPVITPHPDRRSANMSVKGDLESPHEVHFFFEVFLRTPDGFVLDLVLAQSGTGKGWLQKLVDVGNAVSDFVSTGIAAYEGDERDALTGTYSFIGDLQTISDHNHNPWYVTVRGTKGWPAVTVKERSGKAKRSLLFIGPVGTAAVPEKVQVGRFWYDESLKHQDHSYYTFNLTLHDEQPFKPHLQPH